MAGSAVLLVIFYIEIVEIFLESVLCGKAGISQISTLPLPLRKPTVVEDFQSVVYDEGHYSTSSAKYRAKSDLFLIDILPIVKTMAKIAYNARSNAVIFSLECNIKKQHRAWHGAIILYSNRKVRITLRLVLFMIYIKTTRTVA